MSATSPSLHEIMMRHALVMARQNPSHPFGCVIVDAQGDVLAEGINQGAQNPVLHGEIDAINECARSHVGKDWSDFILYTTAEPCPMCMSAILWSGIGAVVFGTSISRLKQMGWKQISLSCEEVISKSWDPQMAVLGGVLESECDRLFEKALQSESRR